jgi:hypothetical protein
LSIKIPVLSVLKNMNCLSARNSIMKFSPTSTRSAFHIGVTEMHGGPKHTAPWRTTQLTN